ncbi:MAG: S8 family serine peptidase [Candidatus Sumerlaeia bacterium]
MKYYVILISILAMVWGSGYVSADTPSSKDLKDPLLHRQHIEKMRFESNRSRASAWAMAQKQGWPIRGRSGDLAYVLVDIRNSRPVYYIATNLNAAISIAADQVRQTSPHDLSGSNALVGIWDIGAVLPTHQEFGSRVSIRDGGSIDWHATHAAGTIGASGVDSQAKGMAPEALIYSYDVDGDSSELATIAATASAQPGKLQVSNHSYSALAGWVDNTNFSGNLGWHWFGMMSDGEDAIFGQYDSAAREWDDICYQAEYILPIKSAGNDRNDVAPAEGETFYYLDNFAWVSKAYSSATDPAADGGATGYDTIAEVGAAKNLLTVGSVEDAVSGGARSLAAANITEFSGWGPTDDGRVKPDVVANGVELYSTRSETDSSYGNRSGTSGAVASVTGAVALLLEDVKERLPNTSLKASSIKGLLIHTADDLGQAGPDYSYGWGLVNTRAAVDHFQNHAGAPQGLFIAEDILTNSDTNQHTFRWNGSDPIRVTLCWTDPAGPAQSSLNSSTPILVNDLDMVLQGPGGAPGYSPFVLNPANPAQTATTGDNSLDNVEQIYVESPPADGYYTITVSHKGSLSGSSQAYSLVVSGQTPDSDIMLSESELRFGDRSLSAGPSPALTLTITNSGSGDLSFSDISITGSQGAEFEFASAPDTSSLAPGESHNVSVLFDPSSEGSKSAHLIIASNDYDDGTLSIPLSGRGVAEDLPNVNFAQASSSHAENAADVTIGIELSQAAGTSGGSVHYKIIGGTATASADYTLAGSGQINFNAGDTSGEISLSISEDAIDENDETLLVQLQDSSNLSLGNDVEHTMTITDNDAEPTIAFSETNYQVDENAGSVQLRVSLSGNETEKTIQFTANTSDDSATAGNDYTAINTSYSISPGQRNYDFSVEILDDTSAEYTEALSVSISSPQNASLGESNATVSILDNDVPAETAQIVSVEAPGSWFSGAWDYTVGDWAGSKDGNGNDSYGYTLEPDHWLCICVYDNNLGVWTEGIFAYKQVWVSPNTEIQPMPALTMMNGTGPKPAASTRSATEARFAMNQTYFTKTNGNMNIGSWNFSLSQWQAEETAENFIFFEHPQPYDQWLGICLFNTDTSQWQEGLYVYHQSWYAP